MRLLGELHDQDGVLCRKTDQHDEADLDQDVAVEAADVHADHGRENTHRHDQDDGQRQQPALVERRQQQEDEQHGQAEGQDRGVARQLLLQRDLGPFEAETRRQHLLRQRLHGGDTLPRGVAALQGHLHFGRRIEIVAGDTVGTGDVLEGRDGADRHHLAAHAARLEVLDVAQGEAIGIVGLHGHAVGAAEDVEVVDVGRAHVGRQRLEDARDRHAELLGLGAVDVGEDLRRARIVEREGLGQARRLSSRPCKRPRGAFQRCQAARRAILHVTLEAAAGADAGHRGGFQHEHEGLAQREHLAAQVGQDHVLGDARPFLERLQGHEDHAGVGRVGEGRAVEADERDGVRHARPRQDDLAGLADQRVRPLERRAGGKLHGRDQVGAVELRHQAGRGRGEAVLRERQQARIDHQHDEAHADHPRRHAAVEIRERLEAAVEVVEEPADRPGEAIHQAGLGLLDMRQGMGLQQQRRHRRRQRQRHEGRDRGRGGDGDGELLVEGALQAGDEGRRQEHRDQHQRDRDQRAADLVHRLVRRLLGRHALCQVALDVLDHDDGVVDHDADRQHQAEQRQRVEGDARRRHDREGPDQRDRDGEDRDDRRAPGLQEQDHDNDDQDHGFEQGRDDGVDGGLDEGRGVVDDRVVEARREGLLQPFHLGDDRVRGREGIGPRALEDAERGGRLVVEVGVQRVVLRAQLDAGDVAQARHRPVRLGADHDVLELLGRTQPPQGADRQGEPARRHRRGLVDRACRHLEVGRPQRQHDFAGRQVARGDPRGIEPDAHRVVAAAEHQHVADAVDASQHVLHVERGIVRDVLLVAAAVRRDHVHDHHQVGRGLADHDAETLHVLGQARLGDRDAVLHQHLRLVDVDAGLEHDVDRQAAVTGRLRLDVEHVVDAVDLELDRRGDGLGDHLGGGAGIGRGDVDGGRCDLGIFRHGKPALGDEAHDHDDDREDRREDRPVDEEM